MDRHAPRASPHDASPRLRVEFPRAFLDGVRRRRPQQDIRSGATAAHRMGHRLHQRDPAAVARCRLGRPRQSRWLAPEPHVAHSGRHLRAHRAHFLLRVVFPMGLSDLVQDHCSARAASAPNGRVRQDAGARDRVLRDPPLGRPHLCAHV
eukprot:Amastigsp_a678444_12.p4 type:complete len:150 gc:universal Amastigsp_a678444_12:1937-1488(-)